MKCPERCRSLEREDLAADGLQPGCTILVCQGLTCGHLRDVIRTVEIIAFLEGPVQRSSPGPGESRLAGAGDTHDDQYPCARDRHLCS